MQMPLLEAIEQAGGRARPGEVYEQLARSFHLDQAALEETRTCADGQEYRVFEQQVRWARQTAVMKGLLVKGDRGIWELAEPAYGLLKRARRGTAVLIFSVDNGLALWARAEDAAQYIEPGSVNLLLTSPPYPTIKRAYGRFGIAEWLRWMSDLVGLWKTLITPQGTIAINLADIHVQGSPCLSPYVERFTLDAIDTHGLHMAGRMPWYSPTKLANLEWSVKRKVRPKNAVEHVLLFSKSPHPDWDITRLPPLPYAKRSKAAMAADMARAGRTLRPSGYDIREEAFSRGAGPIPPNLIIAGGAGGGGTYDRRVKAHGLPIHPARFPAELPRRVILITTQEGDTVYDPMAGSGVTARIASDLGRRFITSEAMLAYAKGSALRFHDTLPPDIASL